jgi:two-component system KDP operon response regulator KdpE
VTASILLIDKDVATDRKLQPAFAREGYSLEHAVPGLDAIRTMLVEEPDLVILGLGPHEKDWEFCRRLLAFLDRPLLLLLSTANKLDRVKGLEVGADDCMIKPVLTEEVIARTRVLLRRSPYQDRRSKRSYFVDESLVIDLTRREVWLDGQPVRLTPTEFRFLSCFTEHVGQVMSHKRLVNYVWGPDVASARDSVKLYVHQLRKKLEPDRNNPQRIVTRRGEGYLFRALADR